MPAIKYKVELTPSQRSDLIEVSRRGKPLARTVKRALALLKADEGLSDREAAEAVSVSALTVARARRRFVDEGLEAAINDRPRPGRERKLSGRQEAHLVAIACSSPPEGHVSWTLHLLADKLDFAHFKRRKQGNRQVGGTERPGLSVYQGRRRTVKNPRTPATGAGAPGRWHPRRSATAWRTKPLCDGPRVVVAAGDGPPGWSRRRVPSGLA